ncbi:MAG: hypothetical protein K2Q06_15625 [Parvularculaceae bacterium]|nr:hypothetical protein [Parvularculaceae bacterium]
MSATTTLEPQKLDDVMLAMDVVDTLRHREQLVAAELGGAEREAKLIERLKQIYAGQGIEVPEKILVDGVKALEEKRFVYEPKGGGLGRRLALIYVARDRWMKPLALAIGLAAFGAGVYQFGIVAPQKAAAERARVELTETLPRAVETASQQALSLADDDAARREVEAERAAALSAIASRDVKAARVAVTTLQQTGADLAADLSIRVVSRPGEYSGIFRIPDDVPDARNYYLIVEAVDAAGRPHALDITSEEDQRTTRVAKWGVRVPEGVFNRIAADKRDDQIIENDIVGAKPKGLLAPRYTIETSGGAITDWSE